jgi:2-amino-4-hydroxy-6-hydroxymethyldihydropteridine diphosphokinase
MPEAPVTAYLSLGSNIGDRLENLRQGCSQLNGERIRLRRLSSVYETEPVDYTEQAWFLNCVAEIETQLGPLSLLERLHEIENRMGRLRERPKGPRTLDIDILLYGDLTLSSENLFLPHPRMLERRFVLEPLSEIASSLRLPLSQKTVEEVLRELDDRSQVRRYGRLEVADPRGRKVGEG